MPAFLLGLLKYLPLLGDLLGKSAADKGRAAALQAEKELTEAKAFARGRISPRYLLKYLMVVLFALFALGILLHAVFPAVFPHSPLKDLSDLLKMGGDIINSGGW